VINIAGHLGDKEGGRRASARKETPSDFENKSWEKKSCCVERTSQE